MLKEDGQALRWSLSGRKEFPFLMVNNN